MVRLQTIASATFLPNSLAQLLRRTYSPARLGRILSTIAIPRTGQSAGPVIGAFVNVARTTVSHALSMLSADGLSPTEHFLSPCTFTVPASQLSALQAHPLTLSRSIFPLSLHHQAALQTLPLRTDCRVLLLFGCGVEAVASIAAVSMLLRPHHGETDVIPGTVAVTDRDSSELLQAALTEAAVAARNHRTAAVQMGGGVQVHAATSLHRLPRHIAAEGFDRIVLAPQSTLSGFYRPDSVGSYFGEHSSYEDLRLTRCRAQRSALRAAWDLLRPGGVLLYYVESIDPSEGEFAVASLLESRRQLPAWEVRDPGITRKQMEIGRVFQEAHVADLGHFAPFFEGSAQAASDPLIFTQPAACPTRRNNNVETSSQPLVNRLVEQWQSNELVDGGGSDEASTNIEGSTSREIGDGDRYWRCSSPELLRLIASRSLRLDASSEGPGMFVAALQRRRLPLTLESLGFVRGVSRKSAGQPKWIRSGPSRNSAKPHAEDQVHAMKFAMGVDAQQHPAFAGKPGSDVYHLTASSPFSDLGHSHMGISTPHGDEAPVLAPTAVTGKSPLQLRGRRRASLGLDDMDVEGTKVAPHWVQEARGAIGAGLLNRHDGFLGDIGVGASEAAHSEQSVIAADTQTAEFMPDGKLEWVPGVGLERQIASGEALKASHAKYLMQLYATQQAMGLIYGPGGNMYGVQSSRKMKRKGVTPKGAEKETDRTSSALSAILRRPIAQQRRGPR